MSPNLKQLRDKIDSLDRRLIQVLNKRAAVALEVAQQKKAKGVEVYSPEREDTLLKDIRSRYKGPLSEEALGAIYAEIISACRALQAMVRVVYLGPEGTFTHLAALKKFGKSAEYISKDNVAEIFHAVEAGNADCGVVPVEDPTEGAVTHTLDMFFDSDLKICSEITLEIAHYLLGFIKKEKITKIYSHPQVFAQCRQWLAQHCRKAELIPVSSTSRAAEYVLQQRDHAACIGSVALSKLHRLGMIHAHIEDVAQNFTRFLVIAKKDAALTGDDKTSLLFSVKDRVGALYEMLLPFKHNKLNLTKIESRPSKKRPWEYYFFVDIHGHRQSAHVQRAIRGLAQKCVFLKVLGSYPASSRRDE